MAQLQEQLQAILADPQAMGQIAALAQALTGGQSGPKSAQNTQDIGQSGYQGEQISLSAQGGEGAAGEGPEFVPAGSDQTLSEEGKMPKLYENRCSRPPEKCSRGAEKCCESPFEDVQTPGKVAFSSLDLENLPQIDPKVLQIALRLFSEYGAQDEDKAALLTALKPFLRPERREKLEKAASIARLSRVVRLAVELLREEGGHV